MEGSISTWCSERIYNLIKMFKTGGSVLQFKTLYEEHSSRVSLREEQIRIGVSPCLLSHSIQFCECRCSFLVRHTKLDAAALH